MNSRRVRWVGSQALLVEAGGLDEVLALHAWLQANPLSGQIDLVPAARTMLVKLDSHRSATRAVGIIADIKAPAIDTHAGRSHEIEVVYDGADLEEVGRLTGLGVNGVIEAHTGQIWRAAFSGFAPGFVYLASEDKRLEVPRRDTPRTAVPTGSVALAGDFGAIYPRQSPGGWQLIGRTNAPVWDLEREIPALIQAGDHVRFVAVDQLRGPSAKGEASKPRARSGTPKRNQNVATIEVIDPGMQSLIEDLGRPGLSHLGVSISGVADESSARQANRLVGNKAGAAVIESLLGGLKIKAREGDLVLACSGAEVGIHIDGPNGQRRRTRGRPFLLHAGETLTLTSPAHGLRSYLAVQGGIDVPAVLGSRSTDVLSALGPAPLQAGTILPVGIIDPIPVVSDPEPATLAAQDPQGVTTLRVILGPRHDWFSDAALARFSRTHWHATQQSNRVGVRLEPPTGDPDAKLLERCHDGELDSEGEVAGAIQVPPSGLPVIFLQDHPVTGGYPVIAVVLAADLPRVAQIAPGDVVRFMLVEPDGTVAETQAGQDDREH